MKTILLSSICILDTEAHFLRGQHKSGGKVRNQKKFWPFTTPYDVVFSAPPCDCQTHCSVEPRTPDEVNMNVNRKCGMRANMGLSANASCTRINDPIIFPVEKLISRYCFYECAPMGLLVTSEKVALAAADLTGYHGGTLENTPCSLITRSTSDGNGIDVVTTVR